MCILLWARDYVVADPDVQGAGPRVRGQVERALRGIDGEGPENVRRRVLEPWTVEHRRSVL